MSLESIRYWQAGRYVLPLAQPLVMGIVNVTPDSFSDGGAFASTSAALAHCEQLLREGADVLDIGAESSRPGAAALPLAEEMARLAPLVREAVKLQVPLSIDTYKPEVMAAMMDLGADVVNDIYALRQPGSAAVIAQYPACGVVLMHMHRDPSTMQQLTMSGDVVPQVADFFTQRMQALHITPHQAVTRWCLDPGIGFGKTPEQNMRLTAALPQLAQLGLPLLMGWSRKSTLGALTGLAVQERLAPSVAAALASVAQGAQVLRVHDVRETVAALKVWQALHPQSKPGA